MCSTRTRYLNINQLALEDTSASLIVKLMICCNDLSLANQSLAKWKTDEFLNSDEKVRQWGAGMYFIRLQLSHLYEGLVIIDQILSNQLLNNLIGHLDESSKKSLKELKPYLGRKPQDPRLERYIGKIRSKMAFHYDESSKLIKKSLAGLAQSEKTRHSSVTRGDHAFKWHFKLGDDVVNRFVVNEIWEVPESKNSNQEINEILVWAHRLFISFMDFSGELIWKYTEA